MDLRKIKKLIELLEGSALTEMEISEGDSTIRLTRGETAPPVKQHAAPGPDNRDAPVPANQAVVGRPAENIGESEGHVVKSPMVGTFYDAPSPDTSPYVTVGSVVSPGDVLCIIEAMKTFNQLEADAAGTVKSIYKNSGDPVEFGEQLFLID